MAGLIYKDFINLKQQARIYALIVALWMGVSVIEKNLSFFGGVMAVFSALLPITAYAYDEKVEWDKYALTMPILRRDLVISKYLFGLVSLCVSLALTVLVSLAIKQDAAETISIHCIFAALGMVFMAVSLPTVFKFGSEKARNIIYMFFIVPALASLILQNLNIAVPDAGLVERLTHLAPLFAAVVLILSVPLSIRIYETKEF